MNDLPRYKLREIISRYGRSLADDPLLCEGLLRDFCGQNRLEIFALSQAVKNGIPSELLNSSSQLPVEVTLTRFSKRLEDQCGMNPDLARWVVESWMLALGLASDEQLKLSAAKMPETSIPVTPVAQSPLAPPPVTPPPVQPAIPTVPTRHSVGMHGKRSFVPRLALLLVTGIIVASLLLIAKRYVNSEGAVYVKSDPAGANCYIDGRYVGMTPCEADDIQKGPHHITVRKDGYEAENQLVEVESHGQQQVIIRLKSIAPVTKGSVEIKSEPSGAKCYLDSKPVGITPRSLDGIEQGRHHILIAKEGYQDSKEEVTIQPGGKHEVIIHLNPMPPPPPPPPPALGGLSIHSEPSGADCFLNGRHVGKTPLEIADLEQKTFQLSAKKAGYRDWTEPVSVSSNMMREINFRLVPQPPSPVEATAKAGSTAPPPPMVPPSSQSVKYPQGKQSEGPDTERERAKKLYELARKENKALDWDSCLATAALVRAKRMVTERYFDHEDPKTGKNPVWKSVSLCIPADKKRSKVAAGESLAKGIDTAANIHKALMESPAHRQNILDRRFNHVGVGCYDRICVELFAGF